MSGVEFAAGWVSGAAGLILGHPIDTVKFRGFFKGMSFPLLTVAAGNSVMFGVYSNALLYLSGTPLLDRHSSPPSYLHIFMAGGMSGIAQALFLAPVDLVKVRLQNQTHIHNPKAVQPRYRGPIHCAVCILREEGLRGLFRGGMALVLRDTPTLAVYFATYTALCRGLTTEGQEPATALYPIALDHPGSNPVRAWIWSREEALFMGKKPQRWERKVFCGVRGSVYLDASEMAVDGYIGEPLVRNRMVQSMGWGTFFKKREKHPIHCGVSLYGMLG
ncbi:solute carrier family 25 member 45 isoform X3 [Anolis carolinensis]|uniref:solute carrier family 25 member 45 isoform X3 n=1 Tax=Anolis carolinensis TaxID=28377 RepID=UPI002F2B3991